MKLKNEKDFSSLRFDHEKQKRVITIETPIKCNICGAWEVSSSESRKERGQNLPVKPER